jgi:flavin reductase (DIM6/NTAB) family NADH-FMN oxidoreductase RutF
MTLNESMREAMRLWTCGVTVVTTEHNGKRLAMTASSFTSISLEPPLILVCLHKEAPTSQLINEAGYFGVSLLGEDQEALSAQFAGYTELPAGEDRFYQVDITTHQTGAPLLTDAIAWFDCKLFGVQDGGSHWILVGEVVATGRKPDPVRPLVYHNRAYRRVELDENPS